MFIHFFLCLLNSMGCYSNLLCSKSVTVCSWNVNGIFRNINGIRTCKLDNPLFCNKLTSEIVILTETHACTNDVLNLNGYFCISNCRSENPSRLRSGIAVFIKNNLRTGIKVINRSHSDIIWIKLNKDFFKFEQDLYLCGIYISLVSSSYIRRTDVDKNIFDKLESDIVKYSCSGKVMIMEDLNARINCNYLDFIQDDSTDNLDDFTPSNYSIDNVHRIRNTFPPQTTNEYGKNLLDICISSQLRLLNCRTVGGTRGKSTYHM